MSRIGFACKWIDLDSQVNGIGIKDECKKYNTGTTTVAWLSRQTKDVAIERLFSLVKGNIESIRLLVERVGSLDNNLRMVRLSSDILPLYTHPEWSWFYRDIKVVEYIEREFRRVGDLARELGVRLSFHPGQYCVLSSDREEVIIRSIEEFEYHVDMAKMMGYCQEFQDIKINIHLSGRGGINKFREVFGRLSTEARRVITVENVEVGYGLNECLEVGDLCPIVLDVHHHWIHSNGEYIDINDSRINRIESSWRGVVPVMHYSISREDLLLKHSDIDRPNFVKLKGSGYKVGKLRAHSDFYWNRGVNEWAMCFLSKFDIMCESKGKNLAVSRLYNQLQGRSVIP